VWERYQCWCAHSIHGGWGRTGCLNHEPTTYGGYEDQNLISELVHCLHTLTSSVVSLKPITSRPNRSIVDLKCGRPVLVLESLHIVHIMLRFSGRAMHRFMQVRLCLLDFDESSTWHWAVRRERAQRSPRQGREKCCFPRTWCGGWILIASGCTVLTPMTISFSDIL
jgi:hypothetical protein